MTDQITEDNFGEAIAPYLEHHNPAHSEVQIDFFIIGNGGEGHPWGMYRQAMRELASRQAQLVGALHSRATGQLDLKEHIIDLEDIEVGTDPRRGNIARERLVLEYKLTEQKLAAEDERIERILREGRQVLLRTRELHEGLTREHGELTPDVLRRLDEAFWVHSFKQRLALASMSGTAIPRDVITVLPLLPPRMRDPIMWAMAEPQANINSFEFVKTPELALEGVG